MTDWLALAQEYVGTPYADAPCWELLRRIYQRGHGVDLPRYEYGRTDDEIHPVVRRALPQWREVEKPEAGDAVLLWVRRPSLPSHVGVYVGDGMMLHTFEGSSGGGSAVIERISSTDWSRRVAGYYRHESRFPGWTLRVRPHPFAPSPTEVAMERGATIHQALIRSGIRKERDGKILVTIGDEQIEPRWWGKVRPRAGIVVEAQSVPGDPITLFLAIGGAAGSALIGTSAAIAVPLSIAAGVVGTAAIYAGAYALTTMLAAPPEQGKQEGARGPAQSPQASGVGNRLNPWGPVPVAYGVDMRVFPPLAAPPYTETVGGERHWRMLLCVGKGRYYIDRTGETGRSGIEVGGIPIEDIQGSGFEVFDGATYALATEYEDTVVDPEPTEDPRQVAPVGYWRLSTLNSAVGGSALTASGATVGGTSILAGQPGGCATFDGSNDYLEVASSPLASFAGDWTIKFWFQPDGFGNRTLVSWGPYRGPEIAQNEDGGISILGGIGIDAKRVEISGTVGNRSRLIALRSRSGLLDLWVDNARFALGATQGYSAPDRITLGARRTPSGTYERFYDGRMQEFAVYNVALSDDEIHLLGDLGSPPPANPPPTNPSQGSWQTRLFSQTVQEVPINQVFNAPTASEPHIYSGLFTTREIPGEVDALSAEFFFPGGIYRINEKGEKRGTSVGIIIEYRQNGGPWTSAAYTPLFSSQLANYPANPGLFYVGALSGNGPAIVDDFLAGIVWAVPRGTGYEVRSTVWASEGQDGRAGSGNTLQVIGDYELLAFRGINRSAPPVRTTGVAYIGLSLPVKETGSTVNEVSCLVSSMLRTVSGGVLSDGETVTNNGAWVALDKLIGDRANPRPVSESRVDLDAFESFASRAKPYNLYEDFRSNVLDDFNTTAACSLASLGYNGQWTVIEDRAGLPTAQLITNRNSRSLGGAIHRPDLAQGLRVKFIDEAREWQEREILVFDDGYNEDGSDGLTAATKYESIEVRGLTTEAAVREHVRIRLAMARNRNEEWRREMFLDAVRVHRGSVAKLQDWASLVGQHSGRVTGRTTGGGGTTVTAITVDETIVYEAAVNYGLVWRQPDGTVRRADVTNPGASESLTITFSSAQPIAQAPAVGDLVAFGERNEETVDVLVRDVVRRGLKAELSLIPYVPAVFDAGEGPVPFDPVVANPVTLVEYGTPAAPVVARIESDERWLLVTQAGVQPQMRVSLAVNDGARAGIATAQVRFRAASDRFTMPWQYSDWAQASTLVLVCGPVETGLDYDVEARVAKADGRVSPWSSRIVHRVIGTSTPPPDVTQVRVDGDLITWTYDLRAVPDLAGFRLRFVYGQPRNANAAWEGAHRISDLFQGTSYATAAVPSGNAVTLLVKAVDVAGNESENAAAVYFVGRVDPNVIVTVMDSDVDSWSGTKLNGTVDGGTGDLVADVTPGDGIGDPMFTDPESPMFAIDPTEDLFGVSSKRMTYVRGVTVKAGYESRPLWSDFTFTTEEAHPRIDWAYYGPSAMFSSVPTDPMFPSIDGAMFGGDTEPMFGASTDPMFPVDAMWPGPVISDYTPWPGQTLPRAIVYVYRVTVPAMPGATPPRLTRFRLLSDVDDLVETLNDVPVSVEGSRIPLTELFSVIQHIGFIIQEIPGETATSVRFLDRQPFGPLVQAFDDAGDPVAATIDFEVRGAPLLD